MSMVTTGRRSEDGENVLPFISFFRMWQPISEHETRGLLVVLPLTLKHRGITRKTPTRHT